MRPIAALLSLLFIASNTNAQKEGKLTPYKVDHLTRGYFHASSNGPAELNGYGGWGGSSNGSTTFAPRENRTGLVLTVDTTRVVPFYEKYQGRVVELCNYGPDTLYFPAQDSRLYMKTLAKKKGQYADIEYLPSSWCGNSYHTLFLAPGEKWSFVMPKYSGPKTTRMRLELHYKRSLMGEDLVLHSHEFPGTVNMKQFSKKMGYQPKGLMDPYDE